MDGRLSKLFAVFMISTIILSAIPTHSLSYEVLGLYNVHISFSDSPPKTSMKFYVPVTQGMFKWNSTNIRLDTRTYITKEVSTRFGTALKVEHSRRESYSYVVPGPNPSRRLSLLLNESGASLESMLYVYDTGEVLRYVKIEVVPSRDLYDRIWGASLTYLVRAVFYGSEYEGLALDVVEESITSILQPELALVIPYYTAYPEFAGAMYANRTVGEVDVEFRDGRFYASFKVIDENRVLPAMIYRKVSLDEVCKPTLGLEYACQKSYEEEAVQMTHRLTLKEMLDRMYGEWRKAAQQSITEDEWRERVAPVEREMWEYLSLVYHIRHLPIYPQDPLLWLTVTDVVFTYVADVEVSANFTLDKLTPDRSLKPGPVSDYWAFKELVANATHVPAEMVFYFKHATDAWSVMDWSALIIISATEGFRLFNVSEIRDRLVQKIDAPRQYVTVLLADLVIPSLRLYNTTATIPLWLDELKYVCRVAGVLENGVVWGEDSCVIYIPLMVVGELIYLALHPEILKLLDTPTMPMPTTITTPSMVQTTAIHTTTRPYTTTTATSPEGLGKSPVSDLSTPLLLALIAILAAVGLIYGVRRSRAS